MEGMRVNTQKLHMHYMHKKILALISKTLVKILASLIEAIKNEEFRNQIKPVYNGEGLNVKYFM